jgi:hypothetical protein
LESKIGDFLSGGVDLAAVISVDFLFKDLLGRWDIGDIFSDAGSNQMVLEPTVGSFHFPFGLWGQGIGDLHIAILQDLLPLRGGLIGQEVMFSPEGVSSLDESEDTVGVNIVGIGESILKDDALEGQDMGPTGLCSNENGIEHKSAVIIEGGDEIPFLLGCWGPEMIRGIMLDQFTGIMG